MPYTAGRSISPQLLANSAGQASGQIANTFGNLMDQWSQRQDQNKTLLAQAKATENFIKSQPDLFGGQGAVDQMTAVDPKESPVARYARLAQFTKDAVAGQEIAKSKAYVNEVTQRGQQISSELAQTKKDDEAARNAAQFISDPKQFYTEYAKSGGSPTGLQRLAPFLNNIQSNDAKQAIEATKADAAAQINASKLEALGIKAENERLKAGKKDATTAFDETSKLRTEFSGHPNTKNFDVVDTYLNRGKEMAKQGTSGGDVGLIFSLMKVMDPQSSVRENEYATAEKAGGVPDSIWNLYNKLKDGQKLQPGQRQDYINTMATAAKEQHKKLMNTAKQYVRIASSRELNPDEVVDPSYTSWNGGESTSSTPATSGQSSKFEIGKIYVSNGIKQKWDGTKFVNP